MESKICRCPMPPLCHILQPAKSLSQQPFAVCKGDEIDWLCLGQAENTWPRTSQGESCKHLVVSIHGKSKFIHSHHPSLIYSNTRLWVQGDNTPKELRNSFTGKWACMLCQSKFFTCVAHHHMMVGHTHEDIGGGVKVKGWIIMWKFINLLNHF